MCADPKSDSDAVSMPDADILAQALNVRSANWSAGDRVIRISRGVDIAGAIHADPDGVFLLLEETSVPALVERLSRRTTSMPTHLVVRVVWERDTSRESAASELESRLQKAVVARVFGGPPTACTANWVRLSRRREPVLVFFGDSNTGKSAFARELASAGLRVVHGDDIILNGVDGETLSEVAQRSAQVAAGEANRFDVSKSIVDIFNTGSAPDFVASLVESKPQVIDIWVPPDFRMTFLQELRERNEMVFFALQDSDSWVIEWNSLRAQRDWWFGQFHMLRDRKSVRIALAIAHWVGLARGLVGVWAGRSRVGA